MFIPLQNNPNGLPEISNSLRFDGVNDYLTRTFAGTGDRKTWTWSAWVKRGALGSLQALFGSTANGSTNDWTIFRFTTADVLQLVDGLSNSIVLATSAVFRDPSAWNHIVVTYDTTNATASLRQRIYVNNVLMTLTGTPLAQNADGNFNLVGVHNIVAQQAPPGAPVAMLDGYLSNVCFIDGQALTPSSFAYTDPNGQWRTLAYSHLKALADAGGTNSFFLDFSNGSSTTTLGNDASSKGNNWTLTNMVRDGSVNDCWSYDTPTNNFATLNPLDKGSGATLTEGNLLSSTTTTELFGSNATIGISSGKFYWEVLSGSGLGVSMLGIRNVRASRTTYIGGDSNGYAYYQNGQKYTNGVGTTYGASWTTNDVIGFAFDCDAGSLTFYKNGVSQGTAFTSIPVNTWFPAISEGSSLVACADYINFGQRPVASGQWYSDAGGYFRYAPPSGYKALSTKNLPASVIQAPKRHFDVLLYAGNNATQNVTGSQFIPDLVWIKARNTAFDHHFFDVNRTLGSKLSSNLTDAEAASGLTGYLSNGFSLSGGFSGVNGTGTNYAAWLWKANGAGVTNTSGTITSTVSANTTAGFSIVTYTGTGANATVGHGLGVAPKMVIVKSRDSVGGVVGWIVGHSSLTGGFVRYLTLHTTNQELGATSVWNDTSPTSSVFSVGTDFGTNYSTKTYVAYCFAEVSGFSKIGSYTGNGSADGPFVWCGFRPRWLLVKNISSNGYNWGIVDSTRNPTNLIDLSLFPDLAQAEGSGGMQCDFTSSGFKIRSGGPGVNASGNNYIFLAFAEAPFKYANAR